MENCGGRMPSVAYTNDHPTLANHATNHTATVDNRDAIHNTTYTMLNASL